MSLWLMNISLDSRSSAFYQLDMFALSKQLDEVMSSSTEIPKGSMDALNEPQGIRFDPDMEEPRKK